MHASSRSRLVLFSSFVSFFLPSALGRRPLGLEDLSPQGLGGDLGLEDATDAAAPRLFELADLAAGLALGALALEGDEVDVALGVGELALEGAQLGLELPVADEPGVLAVGVEQGEVLAAGVEVARGRVGLVEGGLEVLLVLLVVLLVLLLGRELGGFVAGEVDGAKGGWFAVARRGGSSVAVEFGLEEGREGGLDGGREEGVVGIVGDGGPFHCDEGLGGGTLVGRGLGVDVFWGLGTLFSVWSGRLKCGRGEWEDLHGSDSWTVVMEGMLALLLVLLSWKFSSCVFLDCKDVFLSCRNVGSGRSRVVL